MKNLFASQRSKFHISLRGKIVAIAGTAVISMVAILGVYFILSAGIQVETVREREAAVHLRLLSEARFEIETFTAAIDEIIAKPSPENLILVADKLKILATGAAANELEPRVRGLSQSLPERGELVFRRLYLNGLDKNSGNIGRMRKMAQEIEDTLKAEGKLGTSVDEFLIDLLRLRRYEKSYMLDKDDVSLARYYARSTIFSNHLMASDLDPSQIEVIQGELTAYTKIFKSYVKGVLRTNKAFSQLLTRVDKVLDKIEEREAVVGPERYLAAKNIERKRGVLEEMQLLLALFGGLLSVLMALVIGRSIERPITGLGQIMRQLSKGNLDTEVVGVRRHDVIGEMARAVEVFKQNAVSLRQLLANAETMANYDDLTGLPNRRKFYYELEIALNTGLNQKSNFAVCSIDLDGFKTINDVYGHASGDILLKQVGKRLLDICDERCFVARLGGDEFSLIVTKDCDRKSMQNLGDRIRRELRKSFYLNDTQVRISTSVGIAFFPEAGSTSDELCERADYALYKSKKEPDDQVVLFSKDLESEIASLGAVDLALQNCDFKAEMSMVFQPQYDLEKQRITGFESLARWQSPTLGNVRPDLFIAAAERIGLIENLTEILFQKALDAARDWPEDVNLSFNLSARDLNSKVAIRRLVHILNNSDVAASRIIFEVTETAMMADFDIATNSIERLVGLGAKIALDDFGTGYSSFGYINALPLDKIKIDKSFVDRLGDGEKSHKLVKAIIDMAANLEFGCIVEGVETSEQLKIIEELGGKVIQGYLFGRPMPADDIAAALANQNATLIAIGH